MDRIRQATRNRNFPIIVILFFGIVLGFTLFRDFGVSWDEPNYYIYGENNLQAYANPLAGTFQTYVAQNPSGLHYGQPFLIAGAGVHALLSIIFPQALPIEIWHLTTYLAFLLGIFFFYKLAQRWVSTTTATISTLLFASQPVLFGISWIDPKDIPFMVFFLGSIYLGFVFSDQASRVFRDQAQAKQNEDITPSQKRGINQKWEKTVFYVSIILCGVSLILEIEADAVRKLIAHTILSVNINAPASFIDKIFILFAHHAQNLPLMDYTNKAITIFDHLLGWLLAIILFCLVVIIYFTGKSLFFKKHFASLENFIAEFIKDYLNYPQKKALIFSFMGACIFLGFASATRIVGPFAALIVVWLLTITLKKKSIPLIVAYGLASFIIFIISWPYLWQNTLGNIIHGIQGGVDFQGQHAVFFGGIKYGSFTLPSTYLPTLLLITVTEPAILLILIGLILSVYRFIKKEIWRSELLVPIVWFFLPFFYVVITTPNLYNNYRQMLFIIPGAFLFSALSIDFIFQKMKRQWMNALLIVVILFPGLLADVQLHPYEYAYYNSFIGGIQGAEHRYDVDYWLTCYKQLTQQINANEKGQVTVYVDYNTDLIKFYSNKNIVVKPTGNIIYPPGSMIILPLKSDEELRFSDYPVTYSVKLDGVNLCVAKRVQ